MCEFTSMAVDLASTVVSAISSLAVGIKQSVETKKIQEFQAEQNVVQAKIAQRNAAYERQEGIEEAREKRLDAIRNIGAQKTAFASGNIMNSSSTAVNIFEDEKLSGEIDALKLIDESEKRAQSYIDSSNLYYSNSQLKEYQADKRLNDTFIFGAYNLGQNLTNTLIK